MHDRLEHPVEDRAAVELQGVVAGRGEPTRSRSLAVARPARVEGAGDRLRVLDRNEDRVVADRLADAAGVAVVITGPPPASIFSASAMPKVSTNSGRGLLGSTNAAQPGHQGRLLGVADVVEEADAVGGARRGGEPRSSRRPAARCRR